MNRAMLWCMVTRAGVGQLPPGTVLIAVADSLAAASAAMAAGADLVDLGAAPAEMIAEFRADYPGTMVCAAGGSADVVRDAAAARATGAVLLCANAEAAADSGIPADRVLVNVRAAMVPVVRDAGLAALVDADHAAELAAHRYQANQDSGDPADPDPAGRSLADPDPAGRSLADPDPAGRSLADWNTADQADLDLADQDWRCHSPSWSRPTAVIGGAATPGTAASLANSDSATGDLAMVAGIVAIAAISSWLGARAVRTSYPLQVRRALDMSASVRGIRPPARTIRGLA